MGRAHSISIAILGAWLASTLFMWMAAGRSFSTVDRVLRSPNPRFTDAVKTMDRDRTRVVLRHLASEINRTYFWFYGGSQIALGGLLLLLLARQKPRDTVSLSIAGAMFALAVVLTFVITPLVVSVGRSLDFVPRDPAPPALARFWMLHGAFTGLDGVKFLAGLALLARWTASG